MADRFDEAKRALEGVPARDVWTDAQRRASSGDVVPLTPIARPGRHTGRWLAVAAVAALVVGTVGILTADEDAPLDTGPSGSDTGAGGERLEVYQAEHGCPLGIRGEPPLRPTAITPIQGLAGGAVRSGTRLIGDLNATQSYEVRVPGQVVTDLVGERVEDVALRRGTAQIWFQEPSDPDGGPGKAVQVRWFPGSQDPCESFTARVSGGTDDENRQAAVDLAERVVLPSELPQDPTESPDDNPLAGTEWFLEQSVLSGEPTDSVEGLLFTFTEADASWTDGCNGKSAPYTSLGETVRLGGVSTTDILCESTPTSDAINAVMASGDITVAVDGDRLELSRAEGRLVLLQAGRTVAEPGEAYGIWPMTAAEDLLGYAPEVTGSARDIAVAFAQRVLGWRDAAIVDAEPSEDGSAGSVFSITSEGTGGTAEVWVRAGDGPDRHVVYHVDDPERRADPDESASVSVQGSTARASVAPVPPGTTATTRFIYGENTVEGPAGDALEITWSDQLPGAVLVLFVDDAGQVIGAWGTVLPAGDFAAG